MADHSNLIGGRLRSASRGRWLDSINPSTGETWARVPASDADDVDTAVRSATEAQPAWAALPSGTRCTYLERAAQVFVDYGEELSRLESTDNGNLFEIAKLINGSAMPPTWRRAGNDALLATSGHSAVLDVNTTGFTRREPYGVVGAIIPFNMPIGMFGVKASAALAGGNTVVAKPPEQASVGLLRLGELLADVFPPGVLNIVAGDGEVGDAIVRHPDVGKVTMTGSSLTARLVQAAAAGTLTPSVFELGGKSPNIVFADADLEAAAIGLTLPSVYNFNAGQACVAGTRMLVQRPVFDEVIDRIRSIAESIIIGDPFDPSTSMGPIISQEQLDRVVEYIELGSKEATLVFGGRHGAELVPQLPGGYWVEPTLFVTDDNSIRICQDEIFGPVAAIIAFDTEEEAIHIANDSRYGLAAGVWTEDLGRAHRMIRDIQSGNVWVNSYMQVRHELPFGGFKQSGYGHDSVLDFTHEKTAVIMMGQSTTGGPNSVPIPAT